MRRVSFEKGLKTSLLPKQMSKDKINKVLGISKLSVQVGHMLMMGAFGLCKTLVYVLM